MLDIDVPCTFWLDAHHGKRDYVPLTDELLHITNHMRKDHTIRIDDLRLFKGWKLSLGDIKDRLREINPDYVFSRQKGFKGKMDCLAAVPPA